MIPGIVAADRDILQAVGDSLFFSGMDYPIKGLFDCPEIYPRPAIGETEVEVSNPVAFCLASDVAEVSRGDTCRIRDIVYRVLEVVPDGTGMASVVMTP